MDQGPHDAPPAALPARATGALAAACAVFYGAQLAPWALGGDNTQFVRLAFHAGVAHPPGYPLYVLLLQAARALPWLSPARACAALTAAMAVAGVVAAARAALHWGASARASLLAASLLAAAPITAQEATHAEVFALNLLVCAAVLAAAGPRSPWRGELRLGLLGLLAGLAVGHHHSAFLLLPAGLYGASLGLREARRPALAGLTAAGVALVTAASLYGALWAMAAYGDAAHRWGDWTDADGLVGHLLRREFGTFKLSSNAAAPQPVAHLALLAGAITRESLGVLPVALAASLVSLARRWPEERARVWLLASGALAGPLFVSRFNLPPEGWGVVMVERFYLLPLAALWVFAAPSLEDALAWAQARVPRALLAALCVAIVAANAIRASEHVGRWHTPVLEDYLTNTLRSAPPRAVLLGTGEHRLFGVAYAQRVLGRRPDVTYIDPTFLPRPWYRRRVARALGVPIRAVRGTSVDTGRLVEDVSATGRPVLLANVFSRRIVTRWPTWPRGTCLSVNTAAAPPPPAELEALNLQLYRAFALRDLDRPLDLWSSEVASTYPRGWRLIADAAQARGELERAAACRARAAALSR
jgi:hypothetical protein